MKTNRKQVWTALLAVAIAACLAGFSTAKDTKLFDPNDVTGTHGLFMVDKLGSHLRFFDPETFKQLSDITIEGTAKPHEFAVTQDHKTAYVSLYGDGVYGKNPNPGHLIAIIDLAAQKEVGTIDVSPYIAPHGMMIDRDGMLYVSADLSRKLLIINPKTKKIDDAIDTDGTGHWVTIWPDASKAYVSNKNDRTFISVIDLKARKMIGRIPAPNGTQGIAASPDGKHVLAMDFKEPELIVIDTATDQVVDHVKLDEFKSGFRVRYSPDGKWVMTTSEYDFRADILNAADLHAPQRSVEVGKTPMGVAFGPDGHTGLVANHGDGTISVVDLNAGKVTNTFHAGTGIETLAYF